MKFEHWIPIVDYLPEETIMNGEAMPLLTDASNKHIREFLNKHGEHLKKELVEKIKWEEK